MKFYISNRFYISEENPDLSFLPVMARRKLTVLDKCALNVMNKAYESCKIKEMHLVFSSQYGELDRLDKIIAQYREDKEVSPSVFSSSVHNSVVGQFSLLKKINKSYNSLAADKNTFSAGFLDAVMCAEEYENVLFCYADSYKQPEAFSCIVSKKPLDNSVEIELTIQDHESETTFELEQFLDFLNNYRKYFVSEDGLFTLKRC